ncbi:MAG TPA: hypothetical protein VL096_01805 [Pirellulaceae bacterium]|nr:hypothetical protein [Pirellulaceae bacterium]
METSLHRQLKMLYASGDNPQTEVRLGEYRIDALNNKTLVEIQHGSLAAIRTKIAALLASGHRVLVVKPIVARKTIIKQDALGGRVVSRRLSPKRGAILDLFHELIYFTQVFPHKKLVLETPLVEVEELRYPGHGKRRRWRQNDHIAEDQRLVAVNETPRYATLSDLWKLMPATLPAQFHSGHLAEGLSVQRWVAQRVAYCLLKTGATREVGKVGNARLYARSPGVGRAARKKTNNGVLAEGA